LRKNLGHGAIAQQVSASKARVLAEGRFFLLTFLGRRRRCGLGHRGKGNYHCTRACLIDQKRSPPFGRDRLAPTTKYHAGQSNAQLAIHKALLVHAEIISTVTVRARTVAARKEMREPCHPRQTPNIAGGRNRKRHNPETGPHRKFNEGTAARTTLAHKVRRETDPTV
jgi:hypothetical protein